MRAPDARLPGDALPGSGSPRRSTWTFALLLALALGLRLSNAAAGSFRLDDFHTLHHARAADLGAFFASLARDNHPPLQFLAVRAVRACFGEDPRALRLPALLAGAGALWILWRMAARLACPEARAMSVALMAASTLHIEASTGLRMYALLALASAGLLDGLLARLEDGRGTARIALWTAVGLLSHYHFLYVLAILATALLWLPRLDAASRPGRRVAFAALAFGAVLAAPWYVLVFPRQLAHGLPPGGANASLLRVAEGLKNLVFANVSVGSALLRAVGLAASAAMIGLALAGIRSSFRATRAAGRGALPVLCGSMLIGVPLLTWVGAELSPRSGFDWRYLLGVLPALCLLVAAEACAGGRWAGVRRWAVRAVGACAVLVAVPNARDGGEEGYRGAAGWILARARSGDAVVAADWQPELFPQGLAWDYYAQRARVAELPPTLAVTRTFSLADPAALDGHERVFCCLRSMPAECALLRTLRARYPEEEEHRFGRSVFVHVFTRP